MATDFVDQHDQQFAEHSRIQKMSKSYPSEEVASEMRDALRVKIVNHVLPVS